MNSFFRAYCGNQNSGNLSTKEEAIKWASNFLSKNIGCTEVYIFEAVAIVKRAATPIEVEKLPSSRPLLLADNDNLSPSFA